MSSGDVIAQCWLEQVPIQKIDWSRTARFGIIGCAFVVIFFREINFETNLTIFFSILGSCCSNLVLDNGKICWIRSDHSKDFNQSWS